MVNLSIKGKCDQYCTFGFCIYYIVDFESTILLIAQQIKLLNKPILILFYSNV